MTLYGNAALLLFYILLLAYQYLNSLLISYEKLGKIDKFIKVMLCVSLICLNIIHKLYINFKRCLKFESLNTAQSLKLWFE
jgi:hypothetical protein